MKLAQRYAALPSPLALLGLAVAILNFGGALAGALILHGHRVDRCHPRGLSVCIEGPAPYRPGWVDPAAIGLVLAGAAIGTAVVLATRPRAT